MKWVAVGFFYCYCVAVIIAQTIQIADIIPVVDADAISIIADVVIITMMNVQIITMTADVHIMTIMRTIAAVMTMLQLLF